VRRDEAPGDQPVVVGVAIDVPPPWRDELAAALRRFSDPGTPCVPPHITVLPPTSVASHQLASVREHVARVAGSCPPFDVRLRGTATFRPVSPVVFISVVEGISGCERLERGMRSGILLRRQRFPYHPHVTVAQEVADDVLDEAYDSLDGFAARFRADTLTLSRQEADGRWAVVEEFELRGAALAPTRVRRD